MNNNYLEKLKDPRWQKKRLEILSRDNWACFECQDEKSTLNVHHRRYIPDRDPWDYPEYLLITLCEKCHNDELEFLNFECDSLIEQVKDKFLSHDISHIAFGFNKLDLSVLEIDASYFAQMLGHVLSNTNYLKLLLKKYQTDINKQSLKLFKERNNAK